MWNQIESVDANVVCNFQFSIFQPVRPEKSFCCRLVPFTAVWCRLLPVGAA